jgi:uncharacterized protein YabN with tetrapyrrole methylase and pyrophosphatase domain
MGIRNREAAPWSRNDSSFDSRQFRLEETHLVAEISDEIDEAAVVAELGAVAVVGAL